MNLGKKWIVKRSTRMNLEIWKLAEMWAGREHETGSCQGETEAGGVLREWTNASCGTGQLCLLNVLRVGRNESAFLMM